MGFDIFTTLEILQKTLNIIFIIISLLIGSLIILKYFQYKKSPIFITVGLAWVFMSSSWWSIAINFILIGFFNTALPSFWYLFIERGLIMFGLFFWLYSFAKLVYYQYQKYLIYSSFIICAFIESIIIIILLISPSLIGAPIPEKPYEYTHTIFDILLLLGILIAVVVTGILFSLQSIKSDDITLQWKGRFLFLSFISFVVGSILNGLLHILIPFNAFTTILIRGILISSAIEYYLGFFLPKTLFKSSSQ
ncbi:MAG: conserved membrane protein of unknown function [Promethearchaeota archaeon]|nr:MAG: conserved membrane protein of unknown function [Candidatus Lokiarchaeota archaeon]